jgi:quercetin 2,3-dioxygenase
MPAPTLVPAHEAEIAPGVTVRRLLPRQARRRIGAWCFLDHFGPTPAGAAHMEVGPHPHVGLQTATWLFDGEILHVDSTGARQEIRPGQLNLMTAGRGVAHTEDLLRAHTGMHGVQLWIALPDRARFVAPSFVHHSDPPRVSYGGVDAIVVVGETLDVASPAVVHTPLLLAQLDLPAGLDALWPLRPEFEHGIAVVDGEVDVDGAVGAPGSLVDLGRGRGEVRLRTAAPARLMLLGGAPFPEPIVMAWNWVVRTADEARRVREAWERGDGAGDLSVFGDRPRIPAPPLSASLVPR